MGLQFPPQVVKFKTFAEPAPEWRLVSTEAMLHALGQEEAFDPKNIEDARRRVMSSIVRRQGQRPFREALLLAYGGRCAVTGCDVTDALEGHRYFQAVKADPLGGSPARPKAWARGARG